MSHTRRRHQQEPPRRRWRLVALLGFAAALVIYACRSDEVEPRRAGRPRPPAAKQYQLLERSWGNLPPAPDADEDDDPERTRMLALQAQQWQNLDISVQGER